jgi:hypothetical protein
MFFAAKTFKPSLETFRKHFSVSFYSKEMPEWITTGIQETERREPTPSCVLIMNICRRNKEETLYRTNTRR